MTLEAEFWPPVFANWVAHAAGQPQLAGYEFPLYTDANISGSLREGLGPYQFLNSSAAPPSREASVAITLRLTIHVDYAIYHDRPFDRTDETFYHGGGIADEIAALLSLAAGIRVQAADVSRVFSDDDSAGFPRTNATERVPMLLTQRWSTILPNVVGTRDLAVAVPFLQRLDRLEHPSAVALLRAARLYQQATWMAEAEPHLAWLLLVSAVETGALAWRAADATEAERLEEARPSLYKRLVSVGGEALAGYVASEIAASLGSTSKFLKFALAFLPDAPPVRPDEWGQFNWSRRNWKKTLSMIYNYRSRALHAGLPFPDPMCEAPFRHETWRTWAERPTFTASRVKGGTWRIADAPLYINTFEYVARGVLTRWWASLTA